MNQYSRDQKEFAADIVRAARERQAELRQQADLEHVQAHKHLRQEYLQQMYDRERDRADMVVIPPEPDPGPRREPAPARPPAGLDPRDPFTYDAKRAFRQATGLPYPD